MMVSLVWMTEGRRVPRASFAAFRVGKTHRDSTSEDLLVEDRRTSWKDP